MTRRVFLLVAIGLLALAPIAMAVETFFDSGESGCDGSDANVLFCDDFEHAQDGSTPGTWWFESDAAGNTRNKGWHGIPFWDNCDNTQGGCPIPPSGRVSCGAGVTPFGNCAATSGTLDGGEGGNYSAIHAFSGHPEVQELYVRYYVKPSSGFLFSGQKVITFNRCCFGGGIFWGGFGYNIGTSGRNSATSALAITNNIGGNSIWNQNQGNDLTITGGNWYFYELRVKLNTVGNADGIFQLWGNNCGPNGTSCGAAPILRTSHSVIPWGKTASNGGIGDVWWENWANNDLGQGSLGTELYDQIKVSRVGPIGFSGVAPVTPPAAPSGLTGCVGVGCLP